MEERHRLALAIACAYAMAAFAFLMKQRFPKLDGRWIGWILMPAILACPLFLSADRIMLRALAAFLVNEVAMKVVDFFRRNRSLSFRDFVWLMVPFPTLAIVFPKYKRRLAQPDDPWPHLVRIVVGSLWVVASFMLLHQAQRVDFLRSNFALDHAYKLLLFIPTIEAISRVLFALERLAGFDTTPVIHNAYLARTPAEFWRRYNGRVHDWMIANVYEPTGGRRAPVRGVTTVFLFSGVFHELMFGIATSRFDGSQLLFFLLQIPGVLASGILERFSRRNGVWGRVFAHVVTIFFMAATSVLFFKGMSRVFPFVYASPTPG